MTSERTLRLVTPKDRFEWERIVRRCRINPIVKLVGFTMAQYGDHHGRNIFPGFPRLAAGCGIGESTARRHVGTLLAIGLVDRVSHGGGRARKAAVYRLTYPEDLLTGAVIQMLDVDELTPMRSGIGILNSAHVESGVEDDYSAQHVERSNDGYSAQSVDLLRSVGAPTPLTQVSAHQGDHPSLHQGHGSPEVTISPEATRTTANPDDPPDPAAPPR